MMRKLLFISCLALLAGTVRAEDEGFSTPGGGDGTSGNLSVNTSSGNFVGTGSSTNTKTGGLTVVGDVMVGHNLTFPSGAGVLQLQHTIKGGSANTGSAVGGTINIIAGDGNASTAPGGEITLKSGQCQNCAGSGANALQGSFGAFGSGIEFWTTKPDNTPNNGRATPAVKITGRGRFLIGITTAGGTFSPNEDAIVVISSINATTNNFAMLQVSTGLTGNNAMLRVDVTSTTFGASQTRVAISEGSLGIGVGTQTIASKLVVYNGSITVQSVNPGLNGNNIGLEVKNGTITFTQSPLWLSTITYTLGTPGAGNAVIFASNTASTADIYVKDSAGNQTNIGPHDDDGNWMFFSVNDKTGKVIFVPMEEMIADIEKLTGKQYIFHEYMGHKKKVGAYNRLDGH